MNLTACGVKCDSCPHHGKKCGGCAQVKGAPWWAVEHMPKKVCPIFDCSANEKKLKNCGACPKLPCKTFSDLRDPSMTDQEYHDQLDTRLRRLRGESEQ